MSETGMALPAPQPDGPGGAGAADVSASARGRGWNPSLVAGAVVVGLVVVVALVSFFWTPYSPTRVDSTARLLSFSAEHWLGTDKFGYDTLSRIMVGARNALYVGVIAVGLASVVGVPLGVAAAMGTRWLDEIIMRTSDLLLAFPALLLAIMLAAIYGASVTTAMVAIGVASVPSFARVARAGALQVLASEYVLAARVAGRRRLAIAVRHVLPNISSLVIVQASVSFAIAVLAEAALSYLGLGAPPRSATWGRMLQESQELIFLTPRLAIVPGIAIALVVLGLNLLGDGLRDRYDPRLART